MELIPKTGTETQIVDQTALRLSLRQEPNQEGNAMALLVFAILNVMCCYFCYFVGTQKGYNGPLCAFAGLFGSFLACLILLLMPDKASDTFNSAAYNREVSELRQQVKDLQKRIAELEQTTALAGQPKAAVHVEQAKDEPITEISKPVRFPTRTSDTVICPGCGKRQQGNRNSCYACGLPFHYEDEQKP